MQKNYRDTEPAAEQIQEKLGQKLTPSAGLLAAAFIGASLPGE
jgi:hypothetical protein